MLARANSVTARGNEARSGVADWWSTRRVAARPTLLVLLPLFLVLAALAFLFPLSGDDWSWGSGEGISRLHHGFAGYNGRYLGNLSVLLLTRTHWLTPFVISATLCLFAWLVARAARVAPPTGILMAAALLLTMPLGQWRQTVVWLSGFSNYALASVGLLIFVLSLQRDWDESPRGRSESWFGIGLLFVIAVGSQLFVEHVTLLMTAGSLLNVVLQWRSPRRGVSRTAVAWAVGCCLGAVIMFSNSAYRTIATGGKTYQGVGARDGGGLASLVHQATGAVSQYAETGNTLLNFVFFTLVASLAVAARLDTGRWSARTVVPVVLAGVAAAGGAAVQASIEPMHYGSTVTGLSWIPALCLVAALLMTAQTLVGDPARRRDVTALVLASGALAAPMVVLSPFGPRNFLPGYLLLCTAALSLFAEARARLASRGHLQGERLLGQLVAAASAVIVVAAIGQYLVVYRVIHDEVQFRVSYFQSSAREGRANVYNYTLPFQDYVHQPDPTPGIWARRFKRYYGLPSDLHIKLMDRYANTQITTSTSTPQSGAN